MKIPKILVVGDLMVDRYLVGDCSRISPEAPVQIIDIKNKNYILGGAGNVVNNLLSLGVDVDIASVVGKDKNAKLLFGLLKKRGIKKDLIIQQKDRKTSIKSRVLASNQQVIRFDEESKDTISKKTEKLLLKKILSKISSYDIILISDYNKGVLTSNLIQTIITNSPVDVLIDPKGSNYSK